MLIVISLIKPSASVRGLLRNLFLEPQSNLFVGQLNSKQLLDLIEILETKTCQGVIAAQSKRHVTGFRLKQLRNGDRHVIDYDGLQLIRKTVKSIG